MFTQKLFAARRRSLLDWMEKDSIAIIFAAPTHLRNNDTDFRYRPDSNLYYLTGFEEPEAAAVFVPGREAGEFILFNRVRDKEKEIWDGLRAGQEGAKEKFGADEAYAFNELEKELPNLLKNKGTVYTVLGINRENDNFILGAIAKVQRQVRSGVEAPKALTALQGKLSEMRLFKDNEELEAMRYVADVSVKAHNRAMQKCKPGITETQLEAEFWYTFQKNNCKVPAYPMIVGGGANSCILHYIENDDVLKDGDLVLIDAGAEYHNYAADITRTFPVNGKFTDAQKQIYNLVLEAQLAGIEQVGPGKPWNGVQDAIIKVITEGLVKLGILNGEVDKLIEQKAYRQFYMHNSGHWLGLDVHDAGSYKVDGKWRSFEAGMVLTVEPGIYIAADSEGVDLKWWNIGVRIEDDILVTKDGHENLTAGSPKTVAEIENLMQSD